MCLSFYVEEEDGAQRQGNEPPCGVGGAKARKNIRFVL
jgi:hypothetical protein